MSPCHTSSTLTYLKRDPLWDIERPYELDFEDPDGKIPRSNAIFDSIENTRIEDIRDRERQFSLTKHGFQLVHFACGIEDEKFNNRDVVINEYLPTVVHLLEKELSPVRIQVWDFVIRRQDPLFPLSTGQTYKFGPPTNIVHIDTNQANTTRMVDVLNPSGSTELKKKRYKWFNVWKPLRGPVKDAPLALCDPNTVDVDDLRVGDVVFEPTAVSETYYLHHSPYQKWYYVSNQTTEEAWIFQQSDSELTGRGVPHTSFADPTYEAGLLPRNSIEVRVIVYFDE